MAANEEASGSIYHTLDCSKRQMRLIRMQHDESTEISCELLTVSLDDQPKYTALSYAWTDEKPLHKICLNKTEVLVRPNLCNYLKLMKAEAHDCWIFIDALCINQDDSTEKQVQVELMGQIYRNAKEVVAWLGSRGWIDQDAVDDEVEEEWRRICNGESSSDMIFDHTNDSDKRHYRMMMLLEGICDSAYWGRLWIVQEVVLARCLVLRFQGLSFTPATVLTFAQKSLEAHCPIVLELDSASYPITRSLGMEAFFIFKQTGGFFFSVLRLRNILLQRQAILERSLGHMSLYSAVTAFMNQDCKILHDKIYGLLGLFNGRLNADYSLPILHLYLHVLAGGVRQITENNFGGATGTEHPKHRFLFFHLALLRGFDLHPAHPTVTLVTKEVFRQFDFPIPGSDDMALTMRYMDTFNVPQSLPYWPQKIYSALLEPVARGRQVATRLYLRYHRVRSTSTLPVCAGSDSLTHAAWIKTVEIICNRVKNSGETGTTM